jgi:nitrogen fixation-related uncharacterized protein
MCLACIGYWWKIQKERDHYEDQDVGAWIILIDVAQDRDQWMALGNTIMNFRVP